MNFEAQLQRIQKKSFLLLVLFFANVALLAWVNSLFFSQVYQMKIIIGTFVFFLLFIVRDFWLAPQSYEVIELLGGSPLEIPSADLKHQQLLNIVEEMCLAAQVKIPFIYVLKNEKSINAFFIGSSISEYSLGFTQGSLDQLSRDELQALTAHHLAAVLPQAGSMSLRPSIQSDFAFHQQITSCVKAFVFVVNFAEKLIRFNDSRSQRSFPMLSVFGVVIWMIGSPGYFLARVLQVFLLRQKFKLADQVAVKLTRHPESLARVLLKIEKSQSLIRQMPHHEYSHFFFASTHTNWIDRFLPLHENFQKRIQRFYKQTVAEVKLQENLFFQPILVKQKTSLSKNQTVQNQSILKLARVQQLMSKNAGMKLLAQVPQDFREVVLDSDKDFVILLSVLYFEQGETSQQKIRQIVQDLNSQDSMLFQNFLEILKLDSFLRILAFQVVALRFQKQSPDMRLDPLKLVQELVMYDHKWTFVELIQFLILRESSEPPMVHPSLSPQRVSPINLIDLFKDAYIINSEQVKAELIQIKQSSFALRKATLAQLVFEFMQLPDFKNGFDQRQKDQFRWLSVYWQVTLPLLIWDSEQGSRNN